jgi:hypothetical protein
MHMQVLKVASFSGAEMASAFLRAGRLGRLNVIHRNSIRSKIETGI